MSMDYGGNSLEANVRIMVPGKLAERSLDAASPPSPTLYLTPEKCYILQYIKLQKASRLFG